MDEFLNKLYNYEYFGTYLLISIAVLVLLFIIILVFGKKDQKDREIEATKKLQQLNIDNADNVNAFTETSEPNKVEVEASTMGNGLNPSASEVPDIPAVKPNLENDTIIVPTIENSISSLEENPILENSQGAPIQELSTFDIPVMPVANSSENLNSKSLEDKNSSIVEPIKPVLEKEEEKPFNFSDVDLEPIASIEPGKIEQAPIDKKPQIEVPVFNFDDIVSEAASSKASDIPSKEVFSSVYVPEEKNEDSKLEMPVPKEDEDIELPTLKKDVENIEKPILNDYNLNDLSCESYNINE